MPLDAAPQIGQEEITTAQTLPNAGGDTEQTCDIKPVSPYGHEYLGIAHNPGGYPLLGALVKFPDGKVLLAGEDTLRRTISRLPEGDLTATFAKEVLDIVEPANKAERMRQMREGPSASASPQWEQLRPSH